MGVARKQIAEADVFPLFRALADQTRLRLLNLLIDGELCVCDLCELVGESQPKVSRHLAYLRDAGLVLARDDGRWKHYSISPDLGALETRLLDCVRCCLRELEPLAADLRDLRARRKAGKGPKTRVCR